MSGGLIQLVARGPQDLYLTHEPQITFFKIVYRRHTNFSIETIPQNFLHPIDFGRRVTAIISRNGDLIRKIHVVIELPRIPEFRDENHQIDVVTKFAWVKRIGFAIIKTVEIEIGEELIDRQYGDWLNIWYELTVSKRHNQNKILGEVKILTDFTNGKPSYKLFIPLQFWFNRIAGLALPVISLQYNYIKLNLELNNFDKCYIIAPTNFISIDNAFVNFQPYEYIVQEVDGIKSLARFIHFDIIEKKLYYEKITDNGFLSYKDKYPCREINNLHKNIYNKKYIIKGLESKFIATPRINAIERIHKNKTINFRHISLNHCFLLVEYIFLDDEERIRFSRARHEYLIEQLFFNGDEVIDGLHESFKIGFNQPIKELIWVTQLSQTRNCCVNQTFNYTDSLILDDRNNYIGKNIIKRETILFNGLERISMRSSKYFSWIQPYQYHSHNPYSATINVYSFSLYPEKYQPSGTANFAKIDNAYLRIAVRRKINYCNSALLRIYGVAYNIFRVSNGICGLVFTIDP